MTMAVRSPPSARGFSPRAPMATSGNACHGHVPMLPPRVFTGPELALGGKDYLWAMCGTEPGAGEQPKVLCRSSDLGQTWHSLPACRFCPLASGYLYRLLAPGGRSVVVIRVRDTLAVSLDACRHWHD